MQSATDCLAGIVFHELAHQRLYVKDDTSFNEGFAVVVQEAGVRRWLRQRKTQNDLDIFERALRRQLDFYALIEKTRKHLKAVYTSNMTEQEMRAMKHRIIVTLIREYHRLKKNWGGYTGYDRWFSEPINNAKLSAVAIYRDYVPIFNRLLKLCGEDFERFYAAVEQISRLPRANRQQHAGWFEDCNV